MKDLIKKYTELGVYKNKIIASKLPSVCNWSLSRKCLVGENGVVPIEIVSDDGNKRLTYENNRMVSMQNRTEIDINEINNSDGIIISDATYGKQYFRFGFIPTI